MKHAYKLGLAFIFVATAAVFLDQSKDARVSSRQLASVDVDQRNPMLLSKKELFLLSETEQQDYLKQIAKAFYKSQVLNTATGSLFVSKAFAVLCPMQGLHPAQKSDRSQCAKKLVGIFIDKDSTNSFVSSRVDLRGGAERAVLKCPAGKYMCNPALIGFDFTSGKAKLRCTDSGSNESCFALKTTGFQMKRSLKLLDEANPKFWEEFEDGIRAHCTDEAGAYLEGDAGCKYIKRQLTYATQKYRSRLDAKYKNLADVLGIDAKNDSACELQAPQGVTGLARLTNPDSLNQPGVKIYMDPGRGQCFQLKADARVECRADRRCKVINSSGQEIQNFVQHSGTRFYNFNCGACNNASVTDLRICNTNQAAASEDLRETFNRQDNDFSLISSSLDRCRELISEIRSYKIPDAVLERHDGDADQVRAQQAIQ